ncbi:MAG: hypothetical protein C4547_11555, partial [Phycisphaerales bacterium]
NHIEVKKVGEDPRKFTEDEIWILYGEWLHRAHGFEPFGISCGQCVHRLGSYMPNGQPLMWRHDSRRDETVVSLLYPLTQRAANAMAGYPGEQNMNGDTRDHWSIHEALTDLLASARALQTPEACDGVILGWAQTDPQEHLQPDLWRVNAVLATSYAFRSKGLVVWTDIYPDVTPGNFDGNRRLDLGDYEMIYRQMVSGQGGDVSGFAENFSIWDANYDGRVDVQDVEVVAMLFDADFDGDVDLADYGKLMVKRCDVGPGQPGGPLKPSCVMADVDFDGDVDLADFREFQNRFTGP